MLFRTLLAACAVGAISAAPHNKRSVNFNWGKDKVRGLNIGGWLVLEPWISKNSYFLILNQILTISFSTFDFPNTGSIFRNSR
jgi:hypothetical protein